MYVTDTAYKCIYRWDVTQCNIHPAQATVVSSGSGGWMCIQALWSHSRHFHTGCSFFGPPYSLNLDPRPDEACEIFCSFEILSGSLPARPEGWQNKTEAALLQNCFPLRDCAWLPMIAILITPQISIQTEVPKDNDPKHLQHFLTLSKLLVFCKLIPSNIWRLKIIFKTPFQDQSANLEALVNVPEMERGVCLKQLFVHVPRHWNFPPPWVAMGCHRAVPSVKPCSSVGEVNGWGAFEVEVISIYLGYVEVVMVVPGLRGLRRPGTPTASWKRRNRCYGATIVQSIQPVEWTGLPKGFFLSHPWSEGIEASRGSILGVCWWCLFIMVTPSSATPAPFFSIDLGYHNET